MGEYVSLAVAFLALAGVAGSAYLSYRGTRAGDKAKSTLEMRRDTIADRDGLIDQMQEDLKNVKADLAQQKLETQDLRKEVQSVRDHNNALVSFVYRIINVLRRNNLLAEIDSTNVPDGIHL